jgi:hypothetical protein
MKAGQGTKEVRGQGREGGGVRRGLRGIISNQNWVPGNKEVGQVGIQSEETQEGGGGGGPNG